MCCAVLCCAVLSVDLMKRCTTPLYMLFSAKLRHSTYDRIRISAMFFKFADSEESEVHPYLRFGTSIFGIDTQESEGLDV